MKKRVDVHKKRRKKHHSAEQGKKVQSISEAANGKQRYHFRFGKKTVLCVSIAAAFALVGYFTLQRQTYENANVTAVYENKDAETSNYIQYAGGILKYGRDGIVYLNHKGEEMWNQPCQMKKPVVEVCKGTVAVADRGGTSIFVFQRDGLKGEISTASPIQKLTVSEQGIVGAVLKNELTPRVICYDSKGNVLVEQSASLSGSGYPIDIAISHDGNTLLVSYVYVNGNKPATKVAYYNFGKGGEDKKDHRVAEKEYENSIIPTVAFLDDDTSVLVGNSFVVFNKGLSAPAEVRKIPIEKEIKSVAHDKNGIALVLKNSGKTDYELRTYNTHGNQMMSEEFDGEYRNVTMVKNQVILFDGNKCRIYNRSGVQKFDGKLETKIMNMFPLSGLNKYMVINTDGFREIQLERR